MAIRKLKHPNIVNFLGVTTDETLDYSLVYEHMEIGTLEKQNPKPNTGYHGNFLEGQLHWPAIHVARGLRFLADSNIIHGDIASRNVMGTKHDRFDEGPILWKISDITFASRDKDKKKNPPIAIRWASPELIEHHEFSHLSDLWAFGVVLWELLNPGEIPYFEEKDLDAVKKGIIAGTLVLKVPESPLKEVAEICLQRKPEDRTSIHAILAKLEPMKEKKKESHVYQPEDMPAELAVNGYA